MLAGKFPDIPDSFFDPLPDDELKAWDGDPEDTLDSHAYVWFVTGNPRCSTLARAAIEAAGRDTHVSAITAFELSAKIRLSLPAP